MSLTKFPKGIQTSHVISAETTNSSGKVFFVCNSTTPKPGGVIGADVAGLGQDPTRPFSTLDFAIGQCVSGRGDTIFVMEGHSETITSAGGITVDINGISIIGLGTGTNRPTFTFSTSTSASMLITAANFKIKNLYCLAGINALTGPISVSGSFGGYLDITWADASASVGAVSALLLTSCFHINVNLKHEGFVDGTAGINSIKCNAARDCRIYLDYIGQASTAVVNFVTTASLNTYVFGTMSNGVVTNGSKNVVDTVGGSVWYAVIDDVNAGAKFSGGSGSALASDDVSSISSALLVPTADVTTNTNERDVIGNKTDAVLADTVEGTSATTKSLVALSKSVMQRIGADSANNSAATSLVTANHDGSILERLEALATDRLGSVPSYNNPNYFAVTADMSSATWNTQASHEIATVTGMVRLCIIPQVTSTLTDAADGASIQLGIEGSTSAIIGSTGAAGAGGNTLSTNEFWVDTSPADVILTEANMGTLCFTVGGGLDVGYEITGAALTGGTIIFHIWWTKLDATGAVVAGTGASL